MKYIVGGVAYLIMYWHILLYIKMREWTSSFIVLVSCKIWKEYRDYYYNKRHIGSLEHYQLKTFNKVFKPIHYNLLKELQNYYRKLFLCPPQK